MGVLILLFYCLGSWCSLISVLDLLPGEAVGQLRELLLTGLFLMLGMLSGLLALRPAGLA